MKRNFLALGMFSLCCMALVAGETQAFFGLLSPYHPSSLWHRHNRYVTQITCRPYNAFTPICWGNLVCDGCCPSPCGVASGCMPMQIGMPPWCNSYGTCGLPCMPGGGGCGPEGCVASDMGAPGMQMPMPMPMPPMQVMPDIKNQPFMAPMPAPSGPGQIGHWPEGRTQAMYWQGGIAQANYNPGYYPPQYPAYYPNYPMPMPAPMGYYPQPAWPTPQMPYYWYGSGR